MGSIFLPLPWPLREGGWFIVHGDELGFTILLRRPYEENERRFLRKFLRRGMTFVDVGANQGIYTVLAAKFVGPTGSVVAFEPVPSEARKLKLNLWVNRLANATVEQVALGSKEAISELFVCLDGKGAYSSLQWPDDQISARKQVIQVPVTTLDAYVNAHRLTRIDFVKIDVEGAELDVLRGASKVLTTFRPFVLCELADVRTRRWGYSASEIYELLFNAGYAWFRVTATGDLVPAPRKLRYDPDWENLIAVPTEELQQFQSG